MSSSWRLAGRVAWLPLALILAPGTRAPFDRTLAALGDYRPFVSRLSVEPGYAGCRVEERALVAGCDGELPGAIRPARWRCSAPPAAGSAAAATLRGAREAVFAGVAVESAAASLLHRAAVLELLSQPDERGIAKAQAWLEQALATASDRRAILADLGAVELARAQTTGEAEPLLRAIERSQQAIDEGAPDAAPRFNLALALSSLGLVEEARAEWVRLRAREGHGAWAAEARRRLAALPPADGVARGDEIARQLTAAAIARDDAALRKLATRDRQRAREWVETDLLSRWARAQRAGNGPAAADALAAARTVAAALALPTSSGMLPASLDAIDRADAAQREQLERGHLAYAAGVPNLQSRHLDEAGERFADAERALDAGGSPFAHWAAFQGAVVLNYQQRSEDAEAALADLAGRIEGKHYTALEGRIHWIRGLATSQLGRVEESNGHYRAAAAVFCRSSEAQNLAITQGLLGAGLAKLSHHERAWELTASALSRRGAIFQLGRLQAILQDAVFHAHRQGLLRAGLHLANEHVAVVAREGVADDVHSAYIRRAALREALGDAVGARDDADRAAFALGRVSAAALVGRSTADGIVEQARERRPNASAATLARLDAAIKTYQTNGNLQRLPEAYALRAEARLALRNVAGAQRDLVEQARLLEATLFTIAPGPLRQDRLATLRDSFDQMVDFQAITRSDGAAAFLFAEQLRHWALWEWAGRLGARSSGSAVVADPLEVANWGDLQSIGNDDTAVVAYHALPDRLLIWVAAHGVVTLVTKPIGRRELVASVTAFLAAASARAPRALSAASDELSKVLVAPIASAVEGVPRLVIVPDPLLQEVPFGLLRAARGRYLYAEHALVFAPSLTAYARLARRRANGQQTIHHLLSLAATSGDRPTLPRLPGTTAEAKAVAAAWPGAETASFQELAPLRRRLLLADALHFAGHALAGTDGSLRLVVHDDRARPLQLDAATLLADRAPKLRLVTLSGCRTVDVAAAGRIGASSAGFVRSFLAAGVPTVVGSFLDLDDRDAAPVFADFHRRAAAGEEPATALRRACLDHAFRTPFDRSLLCGSLAVFGTSSPLAAEKTASGPS